MYKGSEMAKSLPQEFLNKRGNAVMVDLWFHFIW